MKFLDKNAKLLIAVYIVILAFVVLFACYFMTQYQNIHVAYAIEKGVLKFEPNHTIYSDGPQNEFVFAFFSTGKSFGLSNWSTDTTNPYWSIMDSHYEQYVKDFEQTLSTPLPKYFFNTVEIEEGVTYAQYVYNFNKGMNNFNDSLIVYSLVSICFVALLFLFGNHSRKIYYNSNLVIGVVSPLAVIIYSVKMLIDNFTLLSMFNEHNDILKIVSVLINPNTSASDAVSYMNKGGYARILEAASDINASTFYIAAAIFGLVCVMSLIVMVYTIYRYKSTAKRRQEVIERAVQNND